MGLWGGIRKGRIINMPAASESDAAPCLAARKNYQTNIVMDQNNEPGLHRPRDLESFFNLCGDPEIFSSGPLEDLRSSFNQRESLAQKGLRSSKSS